MNGNTIDCRLSGSSKYHGAADISSKTGGTPAPSSNFGAFERSGTATAGPLLINAWLCLRSQAQNSRRVSESLISLLVLHK